MWIRTAVGSVRGSSVVVFGAAAALLLAVASPAQEEGRTTLRNRGQALFEEARYAEAVAAFAAVVRQPDPTAADWVNLALARYQAGGGADGDGEILSALDRAAALDPDRAAIPYLRGLVHARRTDVEAALRSFARAAALDPTDPGARYNHGSMLEASGDAEAARREYDAVMAMGFDIGLQHHVSATYRAAFMLLRAGDRDSAASLLEGYQANHRRLSQAQRAPAALEVSRHKRVVVPRRSATGPRVAAGPRGFERRVLGTVEATAPLPVPIESDDATLLVGVRGDAPSGDAAAGAVPLILIDGLPAGPRAAADADRDGRIEVVVATSEATRVWTRPGDDAAGFEPVVVTGLPPIPDATMLDWVDADHDGDLDLLAVAGGLRLFVNHGGGLYEETTEAAELGEQRGTGVVWADFDDDNDVDLYLFGGPDGNALYTNVRGGRFEEIGAAVGARGRAHTRAALAEDLDNDGDMDLVLAGDRDVVWLANHGDGTFAPAAPVAAIAARALAAADLNNDGWLDLAAELDTHVQMLLNGGERFVDGPALDEPGARLVAALDADRDGAVDLLLATDGALVWQRQVAPAGRWLRVGLDGIKNNRDGVGATVEAKAGGLYQRRVLRGESLHFGLGDSSVVDVVRVTWPNGIIQNETAVAADRALGPITEVERLEGSCPLLYTWDGSEWRFINEVLGVAPLGMPLAAGVIHPADFDEYIPLPGPSLRARRGRFEIRLTEELREAGYIDAVRLLAIDRPRGTRVIPDERFVPPPHPEFRLFVVRERRAVEARDQEGRAWSAELAAVDERWARPFEPGLYEGLATAHHLELRLPEAAFGDPVRLYLTGWVYWATGSINLQVDGDPRTAFEPVSLEVPDGAGGWRVAIPDIGLPNAKNSTLSVDLEGILDPTDPRVRLATTMRLYWDEAYYTVGEPYAGGIAPAGDWHGAWRVPRPGSLDLRDAAGARVGEIRAHVLAPVNARLEWRGFSTLQRTSDGYETFDPKRVTATSNWDQHRGSYTRYGEVLELLDEADDRFVILGTGDEMTVAFADELPPVAEGFERDWLVYLNGWVKDGDPNTIHGDRVEPLPFHAMSGYPYRLDERFPDDAEHRLWRQRYNTRPARRVNPPLTAAPAAGRSAER